MLLSHMLHLHAVCEHESNVQVEDDFTAVLQEHVDSQSLPCLPHAPSLQSGVFQELHANASWMRSVIE